LHNLRERSPYSFGLSASIPGRSSLLAVAVGVAAAVLDRPLPSWLLLSGVVAEPFEDTLRLDSTADIEQKTRLAFGQDPGCGVQHVVERLYRHHTTTMHLGEFARRVRPGEVRVFLTSAAVDVTPREFSPPLSVEVLGRRLEDFGQEDFDG